MIIKVCGMRNSDNIRQIEKLGIDIIGFIFYPKSPRYISERPVYLPENIRKAGVFVNENIHSIQEKIKLFHLDYVQLHGEETPELCQTLQKSGIKMI